MQSQFVNDPILAAGSFRAIRGGALGFLLLSALLGGRGAKAQVNVTTYHYDQAGTGQNLNEGTLNLSNVNPTLFGKLFSYTVDGFVYAQPLYLSRVTLPGGSVHNVVYVATEHDSVYAFDADGGGQLWKRSFINPGDGITTIPSGPPGPNEVLSTDIVPEVGITSTPVIDPDSGTLYVVVKTKEVRGIPPNVNNHYVQKLHALDVATGADKVEPDGELIGDTIFNGSGPYTHDPANPCVPGTGDGSSGGQVCFNALRQLNRPGLALVNGVIYIAFASHGDNGPYHGWVLGYNTTDLDLVAKFNTTPNGGLGGIWESGGAPVFDADNNMYVVTGNGTFRFDADGRKNYGDSVIKLSTNAAAGVLPVLDFFTPFEQATLNSQDLDQGSGGIMLLPDQPGPHPHLMVQTGKRGKIYLMDRDNPGQYRHGVGCDQEPVLPTCDGVVQFTSNGTIGSSFDTPAYFNTGSDQFIYYGGVGDSIKAFRFNSGTGMLDLPPASQSTASFGFTGVTPTISASGTSDAILWALNVNGYGIPAKPQPSPMILFAYDATDLSNLLYSSAQTGQRDQMGNGVKFNTPTVANGHVYVGTQTSLDVFGLFADAGGIPPAAPSNLVATKGPPAPAPPSIKLTWTNNANNATGVKIERSTDGTNFTLASTVGRNESSYIDTAAQASFTYFYRVRATNPVGDSDPSNTASAKTPIAPPVLQVSDICANNVVLTWTATADDHYTIGRSSDGINFVTVGTVGAGTTTFTDGPLAAGTYFYRVTSFNADGDNASSNVMSATLGPVSVNHSDGFADHGDLTVNGSAKFTGNVLELTDGMNSEAGTVFTNSQVGIRRFTTSFTYQARPGTNPMADGMTFIIQSNSPFALGNSGGGMGYQTIANSVTVKFDLFNHGHGGYSTGLYVDGHNPDVPGPGEADINLVGTPIDLTSGHPFKIDLSYDGASLVETITDTVSGATLTIDDYPPVDIPSHVNSDAAFVGFGGGTGGLNAIQDIQSWTFSADESGLPPRKPSNLAVTSIVKVDDTHFNVTIAWKCNNAFTATGYKIERSPDGTTFTEIAQVPVNQTSFTDMNLAPGQYFYRVRSFNDSGNSGYTPVACVPVGGPAVNHSAGFGCHGDLTANGFGSFAGTSGRLTDGGGGESGSVFTNNRVDITKFTSTFTFLIHTPGSNPFADGMAFVIQSNSPTALDGTGGGLGYGSDTPGGPRGIRNSIAIKFDIYQNATETDNATGLFSDGRSPTVEEPGSGDKNVPIDKAILDLKSQHVFQVDLAYDGTMLTEKITDTVTMSTFTTTYAVDIPSKVGGNTAFVGFTGGTGGLTATQDVQTWTFQVTTPPAGPKQ